MIPYYDDGQITIYNADVRDVDPVEGVACCVTSPPYNVAIEYADHDDAMPWVEYERLAGAACSLVARSLVVGGRAWVNVVPIIEAAGSVDGEPVRRSLLRTWLNAATSSGLGVWDTVAWTSPGRSGGTAWGSWERPTAPNLRGDWEAVIVAYRDQWQRSAPEGQEAFRDQSGDWQNLCKNVWRIPPERRTEHPAPFPVELAQRCIRLSTWPGEVVFDPFMGSGSTLLAARLLGRRAVGVELSERYCEFAARRLAQGVLAW